MIELFVLWAVTTLLIGSVSSILSKKYGVEIALGAFVALVLVANIIAGKLIQVGPFIVPAAVLAYSTSFLITDIINEKWGKETARKAVWAGFFANLVLVAMIFLAISFESAEGSPLSTSEFAKVFGLTPRIVLASMIAYLASQNHDVWAFNWWKKKTNGKHLWLRNNASTLVSQAIDSFLFVGIAFYGLLPNPVLFSMMIGQWIVKLLIAVGDTPFFYFSCKLIDETVKKKISVSKE